MSGNASRKHKRYMLKKEHPAAPEKAAGGRKYGYRDEVEKGLVMQILRGDVPPVPPEMLTGSSL